MEDNYVYNDISNINRFIAYKNPFRYRSYYYDFETGLYYLNSRYYDPELGRFINADDVSYLEPNSFNGLNLYVYCLNNPISYCDPSGNFVLLIVGLLAGSFALGFGISAVGQGLSHGWNNINFWQAGIDGLIALATTVLSFTGIPAWGMALVGVGTGVGQYAMDAEFHNKGVTFLGAITAAILGGVLGYISGPGVRNIGAISKNMVGLSDDGTRAIAAITNAANRRISGQISQKGMQGVLNLYGKTALNAVREAIPITIRHLIIEGIAPGIYLPITNLAASIALGYLYEILGW